MADHNEPWPNSVPSGDMEHVKRDSVQPEIVDRMLKIDKPDFGASNSPIKKLRLIISIMGDTSLKGRWAPAKTNLALNLMGDQSIDLTQVDAKEVTIYSFNTMGDTEITVPNGAEVDQRGFVVMGGVESPADEADLDTTMKVTVHCWGLMGDCRIGYPKDKKRLPSDS